ncbi:MULTISPECIES: carbohydrate deacetylase [unclassified Jeotgalibaca]|uniref:carbohydrate deacetylase n=1 Tax=unclassified Jeotgalibaca TaxID=2621505 RepID=UPI003FD2CE06
MAKYLIVNADDMGICNATNAAIEELALAGRITAASLMILGDSVQDAVRRIAKFKHLIGIGLHVTLRPDEETTRWLSDEPQNMYEETKSITAMKEIAAQFEKGRAYGIAFDHLDSHGGSLHQESQVECLPVCLHFCATHKLPFRYPKNENALVDVTPHPLTKRVEDAQCEVAEFAEKKGVPLPDQVFSNLLPIEDIQSYEDLKKFYLDALRNLPEGITEVYLHPSTSDSIFFEQKPEWQKRVWEYEFLMDDDFLRVITEEDIQLVTWSEAFESK